MLGAGKGWQIEWSDCGVFSRLDQEASSMDTGRWMRMINRCVQQSIVGFDEPCRGSRLETKDELLL